MTPSHRAAIEKAVEALELAQNGLGWYRAEFPDADSPADDEAEEQVDAALSTLSALLAEPETDDARDAKRYRMLRSQTTCNLNQQFMLPVVSKVRGANLLKGSVAGHLDAALDAAIASQGTTP